MMTEKQRQTIEAVIRTLDGVSVTGAGNMSKVLGCINALGDVLDFKEQESGQTNPGT